MKIEAANLTWNSRNFRVMVKGVGEVYGTACPEWVGWSLSQRETYLDNLYGRGEWTWD